MKYGKSSKSPKCKHAMKREAENEKKYKKDITEYKSIEELFKGRQK